nr:MAG TPA: hypothetical protein [Caudoviricetes sp.]DAY08675.1 MAG TPA: hypothetical protein [Bacteriophage sp.]
MFLLESGFSWWLYRMFRFKSSIFRFKGAFSY